MCGACKQLAYNLSIEKEENNKKPEENCEPDANVLPPGKKDAE